MLEHDIQSFGSKGDSFAIGRGCKSLEEGSNDEGQSRNVWNGEGLVYVLNQPQMKRKCST